VSAFLILSGVRLATVRKSTATADAPEAENLALPPDFEGALAELESLVVQMESGALTLEQSMSAYRRGVALSQVCQDRLAHAEQQVKILEAGMLRPFEDTQSE
jgi:exodeoxyribonuclease VII small subunit